MSEPLNEAGERWDDDYGLDPRAEPATPQLTEADVGELQARAVRSGYYDAAGFIPLTQFELDALIRDWRAMRARIERQDAIISAYENQDEEALAEAEHEL